jgi:GNAT superfamily N-acetyltransferase
MHDSGWPTQVCKSGSIECAIQHDAHLASIFVRPDWFGQGIGTTLLSEVLILLPKPTPGSYYAEKSIFSLPLFERSGFPQTGSQQAERCGVEFERILVRRVTTAAE